MTTPGGFPREWCDPPYRCIEHPDGAKTMVHDSVRDWGSIDWFYTDFESLYTVARCVAALIDFSIWETRNTQKFIGIIEDVASGRTSVDDVTRADREPIVDYLKTLSPYQIELIRHHFAYAANLVSAHSALLLKQVGAPTDRIWRLLPDDSVTADAEIQIGTTQ